MATVAITGAGRGIGLELVRQHADAGDRVFALARSPDNAEALHVLAAGSGGLVSVHPMDVADTASVKAGAASTGDCAVDILYNVAGVSGQMAPELDGADWGAWDELFSIMVQGPLRVLHAFLPRMDAGARVINLSSQLAASTWPYGGFYAYGAAKAALGRMMRSVAIDLRARGIIVGIVHPGWVQTDMGGPGADITPEESARGLIKLGRTWPLEQSGDFLKWNGEPHSW